MATQTLEFSAGTGLTLSCKLFALGSDTVVDTQTATEKTNDKNRYSVAFTNAPAGAYRLNAFVGTTGGFANEVYDLTLTTATFYPREELAAAGIRAKTDLIPSDIGSVVIAANVNQRTVQITGSGHIAADLHELQAGVIADGDFASGSAYAKLNTLIEADPVSGFRYTAQALEQAPAGGGGAGDASQATLLLVKAKTDLITATNVTYTSPVSPTGAIRAAIIIGDDYLAANARAFEWTISARAGVTVGTASCRFGGSNAELGKSWLVTGTVSDLGAGQWKLSFDLNKTVTADLLEGYYRWSVELVSAGGNEVTEVYSGRNVEVREKQT
jgi:hypothetical protein